MMDRETLHLRVAAIERISPTLAGVHLVAADGGRLPPAAPGAHITLTLPAATRTCRNSYTLVSADPVEGYRLIVRRTIKSRGGSHHVHDALQVGDVLDSTVPHNLFALHSQAKKYLLIGGGIGITPLLAFLARLRDQGARYELHQIAVSEEVALFTALIDPRPGERVHVHVGPPGVDLAALLGAQPLGTHVYTCGPAGLMDAVDATAAALGWPSSHVHREDFGAAVGVDSGDGLAFDFHQHDGAVLHGDARQLVHRGWGRQRAARRHGAWRHSCQGRARGSGCNR